ncbi:Death on curing protein, Doc toxin [hydrothermal vent metagenome]|uniref:Death on curing protein, Doc toxin n=1 Tax=hydrothermal vent metagenome TaxID=652676 RepID=A0A3B1BWN9_9ZZZZ
MPFKVLLIDDAARDLESLYSYIDLRDGLAKADYVLGKIEKALASLADSPGRGAYPKELLALGIREFREIYFKPYRIIYKVLPKKAYVLLIADGRRDMQTLLEMLLLA